jgi:hypothetical protein
MRYIIRKTITTIKINLTITQRIIVISLMMLMFPESKLTVIIKIVFIIRNQNLNADF